jgi:predicted permease
MFRDLRYSIRALARQRAFTFTATVVLGLAISINTAVFSILNSLFFRPLPVRAPQTLGFVYDTDDRSSGIPYHDFATLSSLSDAFSAVAAAAPDITRLRTAAGFVSLHGEEVTANYFGVLGLAPRIGRTFTAGDEQDATAAPVVLVSESLWKSQFASSPNILGRSFQIDIASPYAGRYAGQREYTIIGVMPASFTGIGNPWQPANYWVLLRQRQADFRLYYGAFFTPQQAENFPVIPVARLRTGVGFAQARAEIRTAGVSLLRQGSNRPSQPDETFDLLTRPRVRLPFRGAYLFSAPRVAIGLTVVAMLLLVIAASNLAGLLMARGVGRQGEMAIRASLGARPWRLVRQSLTEGGLLAVVGGLAGLVGSRLVIALLLYEIPRQTADPTLVSPSAPLDARVLLFAIGAALITALTIAVGPAIHGSRVDLLSSLKGDETVDRAGGRSFVRRAVLGTQIALALVLLIVAGVLVRALLGLELGSPGYDANHVIIADVQLPYQALQSAVSRASAEAETARSFTRIAASVRTLPDVAAVAVVFDSGQGVGLATSHSTIVAERGDRAPLAYHAAISGSVSAEYFSAMGIPVLRGRGFDASDAAAPKETVVVSERLASEVWPGQDPLGQRLALSSPNSVSPPEWRRIVGVVGSVTAPLEEYPQPTLYVPIESNPLSASALVVRGNGSAAQLMQHITEAVTRGDQTAIVSSARTLNDSVRAMRYPRRLSASLLGSSGLASLLIAIIGVFGLVSYAVAQRTREIGLRMVLGATRGDVLRLMMLDVARVIGLGLATGFVCTFVALRYASHALVPLPELDPLTFVTVPAILVTAVLIACYIPARRAAAIDPNVALRHL